MDVTLRHRSAAGIQAVNAWDLDDDDALLACIQIASGPVVHAVLTVRHVYRRARKRGEWACWCISTAGDTWRVEPGVYDANLPAPHPLLPACGLVLTHATVPLALRLAAVTAP